MSPCEDVNASCEDVNASSSHSILSLSLFLNLLHFMLIYDRPILVRKLQRQWRVERQTILSSRRHRLLELSSRDDDD
jgi:hypothetical protein